MSSRPDSPESLVDDAVAIARGWLAAGEQIGRAHV